MSKPAGTGRRWRRYSDGWGTGGQRITGRTTGALIEYTGLGCWRPYAWRGSVVESLRPDPKETLRGAMRRCERWLSRHTHTATRGKR